MLLSVNAFPGNLTHDVSIVSTILNWLSYRNNKNIKNIKNKYIKNVILLKYLCFKMIKNIDYLLF